MPHRPKEAPCDGVASVRERADSLYANGILSSFPFVGAMAAAMDKATQRGRKWAHCRSEGRREAGTLKCRRSLRASNLREESFYDTTAALHSAAAVTDRFGERLEQASLV